MNFSCRSPLNEVSSSVVSSSTSPQTDSNTVTSSFLKPPSVVNFCETQAHLDHNDRFLQRCQHKLSQGLATLAELEKQLSTLRANGKEIEIIQGQIDALKKKRKEYFFSEDIDGKTDEELNQKLSLMQSKLIVNFMKLRQETQENERLKAEMGVKNSVEKVQEEVKPRARPRKSVAASKATVQVEPDLPTTIPTTKKPSLPKPSASKTKDNPLKQANKSRKVKTGTETIVQVSEPESSVSHTEPNAPSSLSSFSIISQSKTVITVPGQSKFMVLYGSNLILFVTNSGRVTRSMVRCNK